MTTEANLDRETHACAGCGAGLSPALLACPSCGQLVHAAALKRIAAESAVAEQSGQVSSALAGYRQALQLLPSDTLQHQRLLAKVQALSAQLQSTDTDARGAASPAAAATPNGGSRGGKWAAGLGAIGLAIAKFKWLILIALGKGKLLLFGLLQAKTFFSMALTLGLYSSAYGWQFALGLVVSIYIHEMGHVAALKRYGISATAPMFIPGFGAFVRLNQHPATAGEDARVGLAGPIWGAAAAVGALGFALALDSPIMRAIAHVGAYINLFNLLPVWQLDGGRGFSALSQRQRMLVAAVLWGLALMVGDVLLIILAVAASVRAAMRANAPEQGDNEVVMTYLALAAGLTFLMLRAKA